jgi:hypothetical protein
VAEGEEGEEGEEEREGEDEAPSGREGCEVMTEERLSWKVGVTMTGDLRMCTMRIARTFATSATQSGLKEKGASLRTSAGSIDASFAEIVSRLWITSTCAISLNLRGSTSSCNSF